MAGMTRTTAADVKVGDVLHRVDPVNSNSWVHDRAYDTEVLDVQRETHNGVEYAMFVLMPKAPARSSVVRTPLDRGVVVVR